MSVLTEHDRYQVAKRLTLMSVLLNCFLSVIKVSVGMIGRSPALIADGIHSLSDLLSDFLVLIAAHCGSRVADENHPYGHRRFETFGTLCIGLFLIAVGVAIGYDAIVRIMHHETLRPDIWTLLVALLSIGLNECRHYYMKRAALNIQSDMLYANAEHSRGDSLASIVVAVGILGSMLGWTFLDASAAFIVGALIVRMGIKWFFKAGYELSDGGLSSQEAEKLVKIIEDVPQVLHLHHLRTRRMGGQIFLDVHIEVPPKITVSEGHYIGHQVRVRLMQSDSAIQDVTVHVDVECHPEDRLRRPLRSRADLLKRYQSAWEQVVPQDQLLELRLHYLNEKIMLEWVIDLSWFNTQTLSLEALQQKLWSALKQDEEIQSLVVVLACVDC